MLKNKVKVIYGLLILTVMYACNAGQSDKAGSVGAKDTLEVWADTGLRVMANEHKKAFENSYNNAILNIHYMHEDSIVKGLINNRVNAAFLQRNLTAEEAGYLEKKEKFKPKEYVFAYSAMVLVASESYPDDFISKDAIRDYFKTNKPHTFRVVFENSQGQAIHYMQKRFNITNEELSKAFAKNNLNALLSQLRSDPQSIGILPFSYISDIESQATIEMLNGLKVLGVQYADSTGKTVMFYPSQETIATKEYPFISPMLFMNCNMDKKGGTTFINYLFKPKAQRLVLKCGIVPAIFPGREVKIITQ
ncbi:MAG: substrate-binding domain-containing protein [Bacteroidota bacterium]